MNKTKQKAICQGLFIIIYTLGNSAIASAQIIPDATLPINSTVTPSGNTFTIEGGTQAGNNLFHSFEQFSVPTNGTAFFNNAQTIQNIFSRVTGNSISNIDGLIKANGSANLFLLNPNGIIFGPNARLNIGGSFLASTANNLVFQDGSSFSAINPQAPPLLTINVPIGLQLGGTPARIQVQGTGHNLRIDDREAVIRSDRPEGLSVQPGNTLALVGGEIAIAGGNLTATGGRIELWSASNGQLSIVNSNGKLTINNAQATTNYGDIQLSQAASVDASGNGGEIQVQGRNVSLRDGSAILAITEGTEQGATLNIRASESLEIIGNTTTTDGQLFRSSLLSQAQGEKKAGDLIVETGQLIINGGQVAASTFAAGDAGNLTVRARDLVQLTGVETDGALTSGLFSLVNREATGNGGNLTVETRQLIIQNGAQIATTVLGDGKGGNLTVRAAESIELTGETTIIDPLTELPYPSGLFSQTQGAVDAGNLTIETRQLIVSDGAVIGTTTFGVGNAGGLLIRASDSVTVSANGGIFTQVNAEEATGFGGNLTIETRQLLLQDGGQISASTFGAGTGGNLTVRGVTQAESLNTSEADLVELKGTSSDSFPSGLFAVTFGTGAGGNLIINTRRLIAQNGGQVAASTLGDGVGGTVTINATDSVELRGVGTFPDGEVVPTLEGDILRSGIFARTRFEGSGAAGSLNITTGNLIIQDGATATVSTRFGSETAAAGSITVNANNINLDNGIITAKTRAGNFGNIELRTSRSLQLRGNSSITTNATGTGGNITIETGVLAALENSDITANSSDSRGGQVNITTQGIFRQGFLGTNISRQATDFTSDITATSQLGAQFDGIVAIQTPEIDPTQGIVALPENFAAAPIPNNPCAVPGQQFEFINTGRGGLPPSPREALNLGVAAVNQRRSSENPVQIVEARGWIKGPNGEIILTDKVPTTTPYSSWERPATCGILSR